MREERIIELAKKAGATMVFTWSEPTKVDNMNIMQFTNLLIEEVLNEGQDILRDSGSDSGEKSTGADPVPDAGTGAGIPDRPNVQLRQTRKQKAAKENPESIEPSA